MSLNLIKWLGGGTLLGGCTLLYGCLVESNRVVVEKRRIRLRNWPDHLSGLKIALIADLHLRDKYTVSLAQRAVDAILIEKPDVLVIAGDFVGYWKEESITLLEQAFKRLSEASFPVLGVPGNHDYNYGEYILDDVCERLGIQLLKNDGVHLLGVNWIGIDSAKAGKSQPFLAVEKILNDDPRVVIWHEPDMVDFLPFHADLMLSGHTHGGQYVFPFGITPKTPSFGKNYIRGFYPKAPTPLYVTRGLATTGPPSRFLCPPEVAILTII